MQAQSGHEGQSNVVCAKDHRFAASERFGLCLPHAGRARSKRSVITKAHTGPPGLPAATVPKVGVMPHAVWRLQQHGLLLLAWHCDGDVK